MPRNPDPLSAPSRLVAEIALERARHRGLDPVEYLNDQGLLLTAAARRRIRVGALKDLAARMDEYRPAEFLRVINWAGRASTPDDMFRAIREYLDRFIAHEEKEER